MSKPKRKFLLASLLSAAIFLGFFTKTFAFDLNSSLSKLGIEMSSSKPEGQKADLLVSLPDVYLLPTSPFYPLKLFYENLRLLFSGSSEKKLKLLLEFSHERLAEGAKLIERGNLEEFENALDHYDRLSHEMLSILGSIGDKLSEDFYKSFIQKRLAQREILNSFAGIKSRTSDILQKNYKPPLRLVSPGLELSSLEENQVDKQQILDSKSNIIPEYE